MVQVQGDVDVDDGAAGVGGADDGSYDDEEYVLQEGEDANAASVLLC